MKKKKPSKHNYKKQDKKPRESRNYRLLEQSNKVSNDTIPQNLYNSNFYANIETPLEIYSTGTYGWETEGNYIPFAHTDSLSRRKNMEFVLVNLLNPLFSDTDITSMYAPHMQKTRDVWYRNDSLGRPDFRFYVSHVITPTIKTPRPDTTKLTIAQFVETGYAKEVVREIKRLEANRTLGDIYVVLLPIPGFSDADALTYAISDSSKDNGWFSVVFMKGLATPEVFAHEAGHAFFQRSDPLGNITSSNPYHSLEWEYNLLVSKSIARTEPDHSFSFFNVMKPRVTSRDTETTDLQKDKAFWSPLGWFISKD